MSQYDPIDTEPIWKALFTRAQALKPLFKTVGRQHVRPPDLPASMQPALFLVQARETYAQHPVVGAPLKLTLSGFLIVYFQAPMPMKAGIGAEAKVGSTELNALLLAVRGMFKPDSPSGRMTLGGLANHCWLEGDADMDPGIYSQQGAAILPVKILVP